MKRLISLLLVLALGMSCVALAESKVYALGDVVEDFNITLSDGTEVSLYGLLAEKKAVLINFWTTWCTWCEREFPAMQEVYEAMSDDIAILALSCWPYDTDEVIEEYKAERGLTSLPMGFDSINLNGRFNVSAYPTSVLVDRNGVVCFWEEGAMTDPSMFLRLFGAFTGEDYDAPRLLTGIPAPVVEVAQPDPAQLAAALGIGGESIRIADLEEESLWPFVPAEDGAQASNGAWAGTSAALALTVDALEGDALAFAYACDCVEAREGLVVFVDGYPVAQMGGRRDWSEVYLPLEAGAHEVVFRFNNNVTEAGDVALKLRDVRLAPAAQDPAPALCTLEGDAVEIGLIGEARPIRIGVEGDVGDGFDALLAGDGASGVRIRIGADVREKLACYWLGNELGLLGNLERDELGYCIPRERLEASAKENFGVAAIDVYRSILYVEDTANPAASIPIFLSAADVDTCVETLNAQLEEMGYENLTYSWHYAEEEE